MLEPIRSATHLAKHEFGQRNVSIQIRSLIEQLTKDIDSVIDSGDWSFATRLAFYRHEFAKTYGSTDWYLPYLEIRKIRDTIQIMAEGSRDSHNQDEDT